jgi:hypothetical protein
MPGFAGLMSRTMCGSPWNSLLGEEKERKKNFLLHFFLLHTNSLAHKRRRNVIQFTRKPKRKKEKIIYKAIIM